LFLEGIPREVASIITAEVDTPTIGIGAGPECDGQVLVFHDILNLTFERPAKFVRRYGDAAALMTAAVQGFRADVKSHQYPSDEESYHLPKETKAHLESLLANPPTRYSSWQVLPTRKVNGNGDHIAAD
jgi:3-methyl-2-oxobutanoate hydroxymethyltransferase